jgi:hypothetical protein
MGVGINDNDSDGQTSQSPVAWTSGLGAGLQWDDEAPAVSSH